MSVVKVIVPRGVSVEIIEEGSNAQTKITIGKLAVRHEPELSETLRKRYGIKPKKGDR